MGGGAGRHKHTDTRTHRYRHRQTDTHTNTHTHTHTQGHKLTYVYPICRHRHTCASNRNWQVNIFHNLRELSWVGLRDPAKRVEGIASALHLTEFSANPELSESLLKHSHAMKRSGASSCNPQSRFVNLRFSARSLRHSTAVRNANEQTMRHASCNYTCQFPSIRAYIYVFTGEVAPHIHHSLLRRKCTAVLRSIFGSCRCLSRLKARGRECSGGLLLDFGTLRRLLGQLLPVGTEEEKEQANGGLESR